jgi:hypothetical protein
MDSQFVKDNLYSSPDIIRVIKLRVMRWQNMKRCKGMRNECPTTYETKR